MATEVSAGGLIVNTHGEILLLQDKNDEWTFPKGKIEAGESFEEAAAREIAEEVGLHDLTLIKKCPPVHYMYTRGTLIHKTVHFFLFRTTKEEQIVNQAEEGIHNAQWVPIKKAMEIIGYKKTNEPLLLWISKELQTSKK